MSRNTKTCMLAKVPIILEGLVDLVFFQPAAGQAPRDELVASVFRACDVDQDGPKKGQIGIRICKSCIEEYETTWGVFFMVFHMVFRFSPCYEL